MDNYKEILSRDWLLHSERELMEKVARSEPNTCVNRFTERLNRNRGIPVSVQTVKDELKLGGGLRNGKLEGYRIPKEKNLLKFLQKQGLVEIVDIMKDVILNEKIENLHEEIVEKIKEEKEMNNDVESSVEAEQAMKLSKWGKFALLVLRDNNYNPDGIIRKIKNTYKISVKELSELSQELLMHQILVKRCLRRFELGLSKYEIEEFYPTVLKYHTLQYMSEVGIEFRKARKQEPKPVLPIIDRKRITDWLDSGEDSYEYTTMAKKFGLTNEEAFLLECQLLKEGILTKLRAGTSCETICPTFDWPSHQKKEEKTEKVVKTFDEAFPTPKKEVVPQNTFPKDVVFRDSNVRIINNSGKPLNIEIGSTEIIITIK